MSSQPQNDSSDHDMVAYLRVVERLARRDKGFPIKIGTPLGAALTKLSCTPSTLIPIKNGQRSLRIAGEDAGTLLKPNVGLILQKSQPSSFGRGDQTVLDPEYRYGREILGDDIKIEELRLEDTLSATLFIGRYDLKLKLHKLAIYEAGGHFEWHRDSTHSDKHHGTVLLALNTGWSGGDLILRRNGVETRVDMHPQESQKEIHERTKHDSDSDIDEDIAEESGTVLRAVAFYTDTEHKVEPVSAGVRIVLQYDVYVGRDSDPDMERGSDSNGEDWDDDNGEMDIDDEPMDSKLEGIACLHSAWVDREDVGLQFSAAANEATMANVSTIIERLHASGVKEVAFPLQHLYRKASIRPEYLKGPDWIVYNALKSLFDVSLHPVLLEEELYEEEQTRLAYIFESNDVSNGYQPLKSAAFYLPKLSAIEEVSRQDYIDYTGNSAQPAEYKYFGGGMFVRPKTT